MSSEATPHPLLYVVPARRAVVREVCTYDEAMTSWLGQCKEHVETLKRWYQPLRPADAPLSFFEAWRLARAIVTRRWQTTLAGPVTDLACAANPGSMVCDELPPPLVRLWKGPLRVLLEQEKYGVLGRTLRTVSTWGGTLDPPFQSPMMEATGTGATVGDDGVVTVTCQGQEVALRQNYRGEVTLPSAVFLPGDILEFPLFMLLNHAQVDGMRGTEFNPLGSPFLGTTVQDAAGNSPGRARIHDNLLAMRFQLHLNMTRGAFYSLRPVLGGALAVDEADTENSHVATPPTDDELQSWEEERVIRYAAELPTVPERRTLIRRARPGVRGRPFQSLVRRTNEHARTLNAYRRQKRRQERANARRRELEERQRIQALSPAEQRELQRNLDVVRVAEQAISRLRLNYGELANHATAASTSLYARGVLYGGSLTATPPSAYGQGYRYASPAWGGMSGLATYRAYGSLPRDGDSDRLTPAWTCTPSTLATTYFLLHGTDPNLGGSIRSQVDDRASLFFPAANQRHEPSPIVKMVRFRRYRGYGDADPNALPQLRNRAKASVQQFLESASLGEHPRLEVLRDRLGQTDATVQYPLTLPDLRRYFLGEQNAAYSVVTLSGHEFMLFWLWPHGRLLDEAAQDADAPPPFAPNGQPPTDLAEHSEQLSAALGVQGGSDPAAPTDGDFCPITTGDDSTDSDEDLGADTGEGHAGVRDLFDHAMQAADRTEAPRHGPPVAGYIAAYNPLDGTPFDTSTLGDLFGYEAGGALRRVRYVGPGDGRAVSRSAFTGKPTRFQPVERVWLTENPAGHGADSILFDDISQRSRTQVVMAMTHFDRDALRALYRHPIAFEPLLLSERRADDERTNAFTRVRLPRRRPNDPPEPEVPVHRAAVVQAWYADRAVPFPTLLETRDDTIYPREAAVRSHTRAVRAELQQLLGDFTTLAQSERVSERGLDAHKSEITAFISFLGG